MAPVGLGREEGSVLLSEKERIARFGVVCTCGSHDGVVFEDWEPGGEYVQKLTVKNVSPTMRKLKYKLPATRYLSLAFPEKIELPPGMSVDLDVIFRPVVAEEYEDTIYFKLEAEIPKAAKKRPRGFHVPVRAVLQKLECSLEAEAIEFGLCPTQEESIRFFSLMNTGKVAAPFAWNAPAPFILEPRQGVLEVGKSVQIKARIRPKKAAVFVGRAFCTLGNTNKADDESCFYLVPKPLLELRLSAVAKFVHIVLSEKRLDFGSVLAYTRSGDVDAGTRREVIVKNVSPVTATVKVRRLEHDRESLFSLVPNTFTLGPHTEKAVSVIFAPRPAGCFLADHFDFCTPGGNRPRLELAGEARPAAVQLYKKKDESSLQGVSNSINFGCLQVETSATRVLFLQNDTETPLRYQFLLADNTDETTNNSSIFSIEHNKARGIIPPGGIPISLQLVCRPAAPNQYYRRVFVLIERRLPLFIDLLATGYQAASLHSAKEQRPATLRHAHLQAFRNRIVRGWGLMAPAEIDAKFAQYHAAAKSKQQHHPVDDDQNKIEIDALCFAHVGPDQHDTVLMDCAEDDPVSRSGEATRSDLAVATELFEHEQAVLLADSIAVKGLDLAPGTTKTISIKNKSQAKVTVVWTENDSQILSVNPKSGDLGPNQMIDFDVHCNGPFIAKSLEATAFLKNQRSYRLVDDATLQPPWHLETLVIGTNSLMGLSPQLTFSPSESLEFTPVFAGDTSYQMITCRNKSKLPAVFELDSCDESSCFQILPRRGLVPAEGFQLFIVQFKAPGDFLEEEKQKEAMKLRVNGFEVWGPILQGTGTTPRCELEDVDQDFAVTLPPTCIGLESTRIIGLRNTSRVPCIFQLTESNGLLKSIQPATGVLRGHERADIALNFAPKQMTKAASTTLECTITPVAGPPPTTICTADARQLGSAQAPEIAQQLELQVFTPASTGQVRIEPPVLQFPTLLVKASHCADLTLINDAAGSVTYTILVRSPEDCTLTSATGPPLTVDSPTGLLQARSRKLLRVTFQPQSAGDFQMSLICKLNNADTSTTSECVVKGRASYPTVRVRDARIVNGDSRPGCDASQLWQQFSLTNVNKALAQPPSVEEELQPESFKLRFIPQPVATGAQTVLLDVCNPGELLVSLSVHWPNEREIELEDWADEGEPTEAEVRVNRIIDELKCFEVTPKKAELGPGESVILRLTYTTNSRELGGIHELPLLFRVHRGRHLRLELVGRTLGFSEPSLFLDGGLFEGDQQIQVKRLADVPVGVRPEDSPLQLCQLVNLGNAACSYSLRFNKKDIASPSIQNATGRIDPLSSVPLKFKFLPLEARKYQFEAQLETSWTADDQTGEHFKVRSLLFEIAGFDARSIRTIDRKSQDSPFTRLAQPTKLVQAPDHQSVTLPQQVATLSQDRLEYGTLPQRARVTQLVALLPKPGVEAMSFFEYEWQLSDELLDVLSIEPQAGSIPAGERHALFFRVVLRTDCEPRAIDASILLQVKECQNSTKRTRRSHRSNPGGEIVNTGSVESLASRCTATQEKHLTHKLLPSGRLPTMPSSSLLPEKSTGVGPRSPLLSSAAKTSSTIKLNESSFFRLDLSQDSVSSAFGGATNANSKSVVLNACIMRLRILADIVKEEHFTAVHDGDLDVLRMPRPAVFIPPARTEEKDTEFHEESISRERARTVSLRSQAAELFREALSSHETTQVLQLLPTKPEVPYYSEIWSQTCSSSEILNRFAAWQDKAYCPRLKGLELRRILVQELGIRCAMSQAENIFARLENDLNEIDLEAWFSSLPLELMRGIALALSEAYTRSRHTRASERNMKRQADCTGADKEVAATRLQATIFRRNMARHAVDKRRYLATSQGQLEAKGATALQKQIRAYRSRKRSKVVLDKRLDAISRKLFADHLFQRMLHTALESTVYNLVQEAQFDEYAVNILPTKVPS